jgi:DNA polymerase III sliding clamp (beta) subunit (PCNA family)
MQKKYKITLPDGEVIYSVQEEEPDISAECKTTIIVDDEEYEYDGEYDESDVDVEEIPMNFDDTQYSAKKALKNFIATKPFDIKHTITFKASVLKKVIEQNIDFAYHNARRYNINGVHFNFQENNVEVVAINGHVLSSVTITNIYGFIGKFTIPLPVVVEILDYVNANEDIIFGLSEDLKQMNFSEQNNFKLIDVEFPDYNKIISDEASMCAKIPTKEFDDLLEKCQNQKSVLLKFSNNFLHINEDKIDCDFPESVDIKLDTEYLKNVMKQINGSEFLLKTNGYREQVCIQEVDNANKIYIIMPMN